MLTVYDDDDRIFDAICAGACGYLLKRTPPAKLLDSIREAMSGGSPVSPEVASRVIKFFREFHSAEREDYDLTPHETRILKLLTEGYNYQTAAEKLGVSYNTVKFHVSHIRCASPFKIGSRRKRCASPGLTVPVLTHTNPPIG